MSRNAARCTQCLAFFVAMVAAGFTGAAMGQELGPASRIGAEVWLGLFCTALFSLIAGYAKGIERRVVVAEFDLKNQQSQINMLSERVLREHPSRHETAKQHDELVEWMRRIDDRVNQLLRGPRDDR